MGKPKSIRSKSNIPTIDTRKREGDHTVFEDGHGDAGPRKGSVPAMETSDLKTAHRRSQRGKRKNGFEESRDSSGAVLSIDDGNVSSGIQIPAGVARASSEAPEEISANSEEILKLKLMHEQLQASLLPKKRRKNILSSHGRLSRRLEGSSGDATTAATDQDQELGTDVFESVAMSDMPSNADDSGDGGAAAVIGSHRAIESASASRDQEYGIGWRIDKNRARSRKIGNIEVTALAADDEALKRNAIADPIAAFPGMSAAAEQFRSAADSRNPRVSYNAFLSEKRGGPCMQFSRS